MDNRLIFENNDTTSLSRTKTRRKAEIIDTAFRIFSERGIHDATMNDIADQCDITRRTIYNYFESKLALLNYLMVHMSQVIDGDFHTNYDDSKTGLENVRKAFETSFKAYFKHMDTFLMITQVRIYLSYQNFENKFKDISLELHNKFVDDIASMIEKGIEDGSIKKIDTDVKEFARMMYQSSYGYLSSITIGRKIPADKYNRKTNTFMEMIIRSLEK